MQIEKESNRSSISALLFLVLPVVLIWGGNFAIMRIGVNQIGPFLLAAMRFLIAAIPLVFIIQRPKIPFSFMVFYGLTFGLGQFGLLFTAIKLGLPSGMASLLIQLQAMITPFLAFAVSGSRLTIGNLIAITSSFVGLVIIIAFKNSSTTIVPILLGCGAALSWAISNVAVAWATSKNYQYNPMALVVWASVLLPIPFLLGAYVSGEMNDLTMGKIINALPAALYLGAIATLIAYHFWVKALSMYGAANIAPFSLLIPVIGLALGKILFNESLSKFEILGGCFIVLGLVIHLAYMRKNSN